MSVAAIRAALEVALAAMTPALPTAWENTAFTPTVGVAWQEIDLLLANPRALEAGGHWHEEPGALQVRLHYPPKAGPAAAEARAELIRSTFKHGSPFTASGVTVTVSNTPSITRVDEPDWFTLSVRIPFYANLKRS